MAAAQQQREWYLEDRDEARAYDRAELDETREYSRKVLGQLVEDAEAAGFNPLTALRAGSGGSYNAAAGLAPLSSGGVVQRQAPVRQAVGGSAVGSAMGAVGDFLSNFDPFADQKKEQEYRLVESQIAALNASALSGVAPGSGSYATGAVERRLSGKGGALSALGKPSPWTAGDVTVTNPFQTEPVDPNWSDAATWEQRYGEPGSWVGGLVVGGADAWDYTKRKVGGAWNSKPEPNSAIRKAARWVDTTFGLKPSRKSGRLSKPFNGGGGGW